MRGRPLIVTAAVRHAELSTGVTAPILQSAEFGIRNSGFRPASHLITVS